MSVPGWSHRVLTFFLQDVDCDRNCVDTYRQQCWLAVGTANTIRDFAAFMVHGILKGLKEMLPFWTEDLTLPRSTTLTWCCEDIWGRSDANVRGLEGALTTFKGEF